MPIKYDELMALKNLGQKYAYGDREVMLYACGIGMGADPMNEKELAFVNEAVATPRALKIVPTFASVAAWGAGPGEMNLNRVMVVDGERDITFHKPFSAGARITADSTVLAVFDKGKDKGAVIRHRTVLRDESGEPLATLISSRFARGDGGFGGPSDGQPEPHKVPARSPDKSIDTVSYTHLDEYEVARLYTDGKFEKQLRDQFDGDFKISFHLAPPTLGGKPDALGRPPKRAFGAWMMPVFRLLAKMRVLRGTPFDLFANSADRHLERDLIAGYEKDVAAVLGVLSPLTLDTAVELLSLPDRIRGYGPVKEKSIKDAKARYAQLAADLANPPPAPRQIAAE